MNHRHTMLLGLTAAALITGCDDAPVDTSRQDSGVILGTDVGALVDHPTTPTDVGTPVTDVGTPITDVGTPVTDVGTPVTDVGTPVTDVGTPVTDVGTPVTDLGTPVTDVGTPVTDVGTPVTDVGSPVTDAAGGRCNSARECGSGEECVFMAEACVRDGFCMAAIACLRPETFCSCSGVTYQSCRPDRPTSARGACAGGM